MAIPDHIDLACGFFDAEIHEGSPDRTYSSKDFSKFFDGILGEGIITTIGEKFNVSYSGQGMTVNIDTGKAWLNKTWSILEQGTSIELESNAGVLRPRYDAIYLEVGLSDRKNIIGVKKGQAQSNPNKPPMTRTSSVQQYCLAYVYIREGASTLQSGDIEYVALNTEAGGCGKAVGLYTGPQGPQGLPGVAGPTGPQGIAGDDGPQGLTGLNFLINADSTATADETNLLKEKIITPTGWEIQNGDTILLVKNGNVYTVINKDQSATTVRCRKAYNLYSNIATLTGGNSFSGDQSVSGSISAQGSLNSGAGGSFGGDINMHSHKVTGLANGTNSTDAVNYSQLQGKADLSGGNSFTGSQIVQGNVNILGGASIRDYVDIDDGYLEIESGKIVKNLNQGQHSTSEVGDYADNLGYFCLASGEAAHAEGGSTTASGESSHAEGNLSVAAGQASHAEGTQAETAIGAIAAHAEGGQTLANGAMSHVEGRQNVAHGQASHAEGFYSQTGQSDPSEEAQNDGVAAHAEGSYTVAFGRYSHSEGSLTRARGDSHHAEGVGTWSQANSFVGSSSTTSINRGQHVAGRWNKYDVFPSGSGVPMRITGGGEDANTRKNIEVLDLDGNLYLSGSINLGMDPSTAANSVKLDKTTLQKMLLSIVPVTDVDPNNPQHSLAYMNAIMAAVAQIALSSSTPATFVTSLDMTSDNTLHSTLDAVRTANGNRLTIVKVGNTDRTLVFKFDNSNNNGGIYSADGFYADDTNNLYITFRMVVEWNRISVFVTKHTMVYPN